MWVFSDVRAASKALAMALHRVMVYSPWDAEPKQFGESQLLLLLLLAAVPQGSRDKVRLEDLDGGIKLELQDLGRRGGAQKQ